MKKFLTALLCLSVWFIPISADASSFGDKLKGGFDNWWDGAQRDVVNGIFGNPLPQGEFELPRASEFESIGKNTSLRQFILNVLNFALSFLGIFAVSALVYAGFLYVTAGGEDGQHEKAKKILIYAALGIIVILMSFAFVNTLITEAPVGGDDRNGPTNSSGSNGGFNNGGSNNSNPNGGGGNPIGNDPDNSGLPSNGGSTNPYSNSNPNGNGNNYENGGGNNGNTNPSNPPIPLGNTNPSGGGSGSTPNLLSTGSIVITGNGVNDFGSGIMVPPETATSGVTFTLSFAAESVWDFGDGVQKTLDTINYPGSTIQHRFAADKQYNVRVLAQTIEGLVIPLQKQLLTGGITPKLSVSTETAFVKENITFDARSSKVSTGSIVQYNWSCQGGRGCFQNHQGAAFDAFFGTPGTYTIKLEIETSLGAVAGIEITVTILGDKPTAKFTVQPQSDPTKPGLFRFDAGQSQNLSGGNTSLQYQWQFSGISKTSQTSNIEYQFQTKGEHPVQLVVTENRNGKTRTSDPVSQTVSVQSVLQADIKLSRSPVTGQSVRLEGDSPQATEFIWNFPDGSQKFGKTVIYTFEESGPQEIQLEVHDSTDSQTVTKNITVLNENQPTAIMSVSVNGETQVVPNFQVKRDDTTTFINASLSADGQPGNLGESWTVNGNPALAAEIPLYLQALGSYEVKLIATDPNNISKKDERVVQVEVKNTPPAITDLTLSPDSSQGLSQAKISLAANDPDGEIEQYRFEVLEFGKNVDTQISSLPQAIFNLEQKPGTHIYTLRVTARDNDGEETTFLYPEPIKVESDLENLRPEVQILATPGNSGTTSTNFSFFAQASDGDGDVLKYEWTFPDGKKLLTDSVNYRFPNAGQFEVFLRVSDDIALTEATITVNVKNDNNEVQTALNKTPKAEIRGLIPGNTGNTETQFQFFGQGTDPDEQILKYTWDFGDGTQSQVKNAAHVFEEPGNYQVKFTVSDGQAQDERTQSIQVVSPGETIPPSTTPDFVPEETTAVLDPDDIAIKAPIDWTQTLEMVKADKVAALKNTTDPEEKIKLSAQIQLINDELKRVAEDPLGFAENTAELEKLKEAIPEFVFVTIGGTKNTTFFLYGKAPTEHPRPILFTWNLGDERQKSGQNVAVRYEQPGTYEVVLTASDGLTTVADSLIIRVEEAAFTP
jgi:PKD repeat protein